MLSASKPLPWHDEAWRQVGAARAAGRFAHAWLLAGPRQIGKRRFAIALAARLACESPRDDAACGDCRSCRQLAAGTNPNATLLTLDGYFCVAGTPDGRADGAIQLWTPDKESRRREVATNGVRDLIGRLGLSSHYGGLKVAIIDPADLLNPSSMTALLKTVEEPPPNSVLLLLAEHWQSIVPTLRSRCRLLRLPAPGPQAARDWLRREFPDARPAELEPALRHPLAAASLLAPETASRRREWSQALEDLAAGRPQPLRQAERLKREDVQEWLEWVLERSAGWLRERLAGQGGGPATAPDAALLQLMGDATEGLRSLERNVHPAMVAESIMIRWWRSARGARAASR